MISLSESHAWPPVDTENQEETRAFVEAMAWI